MFTKVRGLFDRYSAELLSGGRSSDLSFEREYLIEAKQRLEQLDFIVDRVQALARRTPASSAWARNQYASKTRSVPPGAMSLSEQQGLLEYLEEVAPPFINDVEIRVLAEAFYYNAWRTFQVLRKLPGLKSIRADGIRGVRNQLLEHPEGSDSGVIENGYSFDNSTGPIIKGVRRADKVSIFPDAGLYNNAREFALNLEEKLDGFLTHEQ